MASNGYAKEVLVTTGWLAEHLNDPGLVVAEVDENPDLYDEGHIPGAVKLHWREDLQDAVERDLIEKDAFEQLMGRLGIANDTSLVLYGDKNNWFAAYAYWYLKIYGHQDVRILNGGRQKWIDEGRELSTDVPQLTAKSYSARERDDPARLVRDLLRRPLRRADEAGAQEQILGRVARDRELGEEDEVGPALLRLGEPREDPVAVAVEVADDGVHLREGEPHPASSFRLLV